MGLFDTVRCEYPLSNPSHQKLMYQTKSLGCEMDCYTITADGRLVRNVLRDGTYVPAGEWAFHGDIVIYRGAQPNEWVEYKVRFTHGSVEWVKELAPPATGREIIEKELELDERLLSSDASQLSPSLEGRALTPAEVMAHAPGKVELVDGRIIGGEGLLRLLLSNLGLRRAARMVGLEPWRQALEEIMQA